MCSDENLETGERRNEGEVGGGDGAWQCEAPKALSESAHEVDLLGAIEVDGLHMMQHNGAVQQSDNT